MKFRTFHDLESKDYLVPPSNRQDFLAMLRTVKNDLKMPIFVVENKFGFNIKADEDSHRRIGDFQW
jgi:hypothetical protein